MAFLEWVRRTKNLDAQIELDMLLRADLFEDPVRFVPEMERLLAVLAGPDRLNRYLAAFRIKDWCIQLAGRENFVDLAPIQPTRRLMPLLSAMLSEEPVTAQFAACLSLGWLGRLEMSSFQPDHELMERLFLVWRQSPNGSMRRIAKWALLCQPVVPRTEDSQLATTSEAELKVLASDYDQSNDWEEKVAILMCCLGPCRWRGFPHLHQVPGRWLGVRIFLEVRHQRDSHRPHFHRGTPLRDVSLSTHLNHGAAQDGLAPHPLVRLG